LEEKYNKKCSSNNDSQPILEIMTTPAPDFTNKTLQPSDNKNSSCSEKEFAALEKDSAGAPIIIIISILVSLVSILIVQLLVIFFLKQKNAVLQEKLNNLIPMNIAAIPPSLHESDEVEDEVNECYGISPREGKTAEENYCEI
jgi:hypothetical protein